MGAEERIQNAHHAARFGKHFLSLAADPVEVEIRASANAKNDEVPIDHPVATGSLLRTRIVSGVTADYTLVRHASRANL
jgi:hypothetical protein